MMTISLREHEDSTPPVTQLFLDENGERCTLGTLYIPEGRDGPAVVIRAWSVIKPSQEERTRIFQEVAESILTETFPDAEQSGWDSPNTTKLSEVCDASQMTELWVFVQQATPTPLNSVVPSNGRRVQVIRLPLVCH